MSVPRQLYTAIQQLVMTYKFQEEMFLTIVIIVYFLLLDTASSLRLSASRQSLSYLSVIYYISVMKFLEMLRSLFLFLIAVSFL